MSGAWKMGALTAARKGLLENQLAGQAQLGGLAGEVVVSALPLDRISTGGEERPQLNLLLLCAGVELDGRLARLYAAVNGGLMDSQ